MSKDAFGVPAPCKVSEPPCRVACFIDTLVEAATSDKAHVITPSSFVS